MFYNFSSCHEWIPFEVVVTFPLVSLAFQFWLFSGSILPSHCESCEVIMNIYS